MSKTSNSFLAIWARELRVHQWVKNLLLFVPALTSFRITEPSVLAQLLLAFVSFGLVASAVYLFNDAVDLPSDRIHPTKRLRPLAAGKISVRLALVVASLILLTGLAIGLIVGVTFLLALGAYLVATFAYSFWLKRVALIDCIVLAGLYTLRIIAGGLASGISVSFWLQAFSVFFFLSLAWVKRYAELEVASRSGSSPAAGRGYSISDMPIVLAFGSISAFVSVLIFALYLDSSNVQLLYQTPQIAWLAIPILLYLIGRLWLKSHRGEMNEDPIVFVLKDKASAAAITGIAVALYVAHVGIGPWN